MKKIVLPPAGDIIPALRWIPAYQFKGIGGDLLAGLTLAAFVLPESMAYATLAGLPPYFGIYCCLAGALLFALFTSSKHVAVGPTSSISLMIGTTVAVISGGDPQRWIAVAGLTALCVAVICFIAYILRLSSLVNFISNSILLGFKAGAALSIMATQLPKLFGVEGGGGNFFTRMQHLAGELDQTNMPVLAFGLAALLAIVVGEHFLPGKPVSLFVVIGSILAVSFTGLAQAGFEITGLIPGGLPRISRPSLRMSDVDGVLPLAFACFLMGYIETISAARTLAMKHNYSVSARQELLSMGMANLATAFASGYVVAGGLSQSTVNEKSGAKSPMSLILCSAVLGLILLFFTGLLKNLPEVILAAIVIHAVTGLIKIRELKELAKLSRLEFTVAMIALLGVLLFGILKGVMLAVIISLILLIRKISVPQVAELGRIGQSEHYSDISRHPDNIRIPGILIMRPESSILYFNTESIRDSIMKKITAQTDTRALIIDLSASPYIDVGGSSMLVELVKDLGRKGITVRFATPLAQARDMLRNSGMEGITGHISRSEGIQEAVDALASA